MSYFLTQVFNGAVNGAFYALLALGLSVIFGMLRVVNFAHGAMYMLGAFAAYYGAQLFHLPFFAALVVGPLAVALFGVALEVTLLRRLYGLDPIYNLLLTFALTLVIVDLMRLIFGALGSPYETPAVLSGIVDVGFGPYPLYRIFAIVVSLAVCAVVWYSIEQTPLGSRLRAATENPVLTRALGINVPRLVTVTFAFGVALAAFAGVLAAPMLNVEPTMGEKIIINTFAIVVIGGLGSIGGSILTGFVLGIIQVVAALFFAQISETVIFLMMVVVLLIRPWGLFGKAETAV
ncbi:MAG: branched-chain amino acid ABC transporter permease [Candidatus Eremiobacteraeota bacterium]|nr:branched-chain amino acid ABC transporter permease [Candidatus Eremiobacteraeota bacterium]